MRNGDPSYGNGVEFKELQMLTGSGELMRYSMADGKEPNSYETLSYAGGVRRSVKKKVKKSTRKRGGLASNFRKNQQIRQKQKAADSRTNAAAIAAMQKEASKPGLKLPPLPREKKTGLSTGVKIGIGAGIALLLGAGIYFAVKSKKG